MPFFTPIQAANQLLLSQRLHTLHFDVSRLLFKKHIVFDSFQNFCHTTSATLEQLMHYGDTRDGLTLVRKRQDKTHYIVLYNAAVKNPRRRNFTLAHEVGHILLGHANDGKRQEAEANAFAAQLLLPRILLDHLAVLWHHALSPELVCEVFGVSRQTAQRGLAQLQIPILYTSHDYALLKRFRAFLPVPSEPLITI